MRESDENDRLIPIRWQGKDGCLVISHRKADPKIHPENHDVTFHYSFLWLKGEKPAEKPNTNDLHFMTSAYCWLNGEDVSKMEKKETIITRWEAIADE